MSLPMSCDIPGTPGRFTLPRGELVSVALVRAYIYELEQADGCYPHGVRTMSGRSSRGWAGGDHPKSSMDIVP